MPAGPAGEGAVPPPAEQELWQRKLGRITRRLTEIDSQMERLNRQVPSAHDEQKPRPPRRLWQEFEFPY